MKNIKFYKEVTFANKTRKGHGNIFCHYARLRLSKYTKVKLLGK